MTPLGARLGPAIGATAAAAAATPFRSTVKSSAGSITVPDGATKGLFVAVGNGGASNAAGGSGGPGGVVFGRRDVTPGEVIPITLSPTTCLGMIAYPGGDATAISGGAAGTGTGAEGDVVVEAAPGATGSSTPAAYASLVGDGQIDILGSMGMGRAWQGGSGYGGGVVVLWYRG